MADIWINLFTKTMRLLIPNFIQIISYMNIREQRMKFKKENMFKLRKAMKV